MRPCALPINKYVDYMLNPLASYWRRNYNYSWLFHSQARESLNYCIIIQIGKPVIVKVTASRQCVSMKVSVLSVYRIWRCIGVAWSTIRIASPIPQFPHLLFYTAIITYYLHMSDGRIHIGGRHEGHKAKSTAIEQNIPLCKWHVAIASFTKFCC